MERKNKTAGSSHMTDTHIHIGQFKEIYYTAEEVFDAVFAGGAACFPERKAAWGHTALSTGRNMSGEYRNADRSRHICRDSRQAAR
jgi:hypothetical protein